MKTTLYGNGEATNEFGHPKVAKETNFVHPVYRAKYPIPFSTICDLTLAYFETHGTYPTKLLIAGGSNGTRWLCFQPHGPSTGPFVSLDIEYDAPETKVE